MIVKLRNKDGFSKLMEIDKFNQIIIIPEYSKTTVFINSDNTITSPITTNVKEYAHLGLHEDLFGLNILIYEEL